MSSQLFWAACLLIVLQLGDGAVSLLSQSPIHPTTHSSYSFKHGIQDDERLADTLNVVYTNFPIEAFSIVFIVFLLHISGRETIHIPTKSSMGRVL